MPSPHDPGVTDAAAVDGAAATPSRHRVRGQANRLLVVTALLVLLPAVVVAERIRRGGGRRVARWGISIVATWCGVRVVVRGPGRSSGPVAIVVPNHASPMDIPALLLADPEVQFVAAQDLYRIPLLAPAMRALGTLSVDRRDRAHGRRQLEDLADGGTIGSTGDLAIFAEGAIAPAGTRLPFRSGAFRLAIRSGRPVAPVALHGTDAVLAPGGRLTVRPGVVTVEFLDLVPTVGLDLDDHRVLRDHVEQVIGASLARTPVCAR